MTTNREKSKNRTMKEKIKVIADTTNAYTLEEKMCGKNSPR